jgi:hypothetical protein
VSNGRRKRGSIFTGLLLILLGTIFLLDRYDPALGIGHLIRLYWPVLIIVWGVAKLIDYLAESRTGGPGAPFLSGGEVALVILLAFVLTGFAFRDWLRDHYPDITIGIPPFGNSYNQSRQLPSETIPAGAHVIIDTERGDVSVRAGEGSELGVNAKESASEPTESAANDDMRNVDVVVEHTGNTYHVHPMRQEAYRGRVSVDLDVVLPKTASVEINAGRGDINVSGVAGSVVVRSVSGDVQLKNIGSDIMVDLQKGDAQISGITGNVTITGRGDDLDLENITGDATVQAAFVGTMNARNVAKMLRCVSPWADLTITNLNGKVEADSGDIEIADAAGPMKLVTHNKDIDVRNVMGKIEIVNTHGDVKVTYSTPPREDLTITNDSNDVDVTLPANSNFGFSATSRSGEVENDFEPGKSSDDDDDNKRAQSSGRYGSGGPMITITTSYGTVHLHKGD